MNVSRTNFEVVGKNIITNETEIHTVVASNPNEAKKIVIEKDRYFIPECVYPTKFTGM